MPTSELTWVDNSIVAFQQLTDSVRKALARHEPPVRIVEAGCGRKWALGDLGVDIHVTGIDLDAEALRLRLEQQNDLDTAIHGDLMQVEVDKESYDVVFSSWVLEHLEHPDVALDRFFSWLRPGGLVVAIFPDRDTAKGFVTRMSPFFIHVWYYRWIKRRPTAGKPGYEPYHTYYGPEVGRKGIERYCERHGYRVVDEIAVRVSRSDDGALTRMVSKVVGWLSFGRLDGEYCDIGIVLEKTPAHAPSGA